jgi:hypothetical protein
MKRRAVIQFLPRRMVGAIKKLLSDVLVAVDLGDGVAVANLCLGGMKPKSWGMRQISRGGDPRSMEMWSLRKGQIKRQRHL